MTSCFQYSHARSPPAPPPVPLGMTACAAGCTGSCLCGIRGRCHSPRIRIPRTAHRNQLLLDPCGGAQAIRAADRAVDGRTDNQRAVAQKENGIAVANRLSRTTGPARSAEDSAPSVVDFPDVEDRHHSIAAPQRHGADAERHELRCMGVNDRHHVRPRSVELAVQETLSILVGSLARDRLAVEIVFDDAVGRHDPGRHVTRDEKMARIDPAADADVAIGIQEIQFLGGQHPIGENQVVDERLLRTRWRRRLRDGRDVCIGGLVPRAERMPPARRPARRKQQGTSESSCAFLVQGVGPECHRPSNGTLMRRAGIIWQITIYGGSPG